MSRRPRRSFELVLAAALALAAPSALAQQAPPRAPVTPVAPVPAPAPAAAPGPVEEPPYDPAKHGGLSEAAWLRATRGMGRRSPGMMATGIVLIGVGATLMATGTGVYATDNGCTDANGNSVPCGAGRVTGTALLSAGLIALGLGIPLTALGAAEVPRIESGSVSLRLTLTPITPLRTGSSQPPGAGLVLRF
jgi:hypothetical protein